MNNYTPDRWVVLELQHGEDAPIYKVFAGWYGGYTSGDSWQLNSGIVKVLDIGDAYEFHGNSGSVYTCHKDAYGMGMYMESVYKNWQDQMKPMPEYTMKLSHAWKEHFGPKGL